ncbi:MAG: domain containing protein [Pedosphaera sp.]|nr:domain containing protein [Pedosphaera sp.]
MARGICRIVRDRIDSAIKQLDEPGSDGESVHGVRKDLKKIRAVPRLIRDRLGKRVYQQENGRFRQIARALSTQRDAEVLLKTVDEFKATHREKSMKVALEKVQKEVRKRYEENSHHGLKWKTNLEKNLKTARRRTGEWPLQGIKPADLCCGIKKSCEKGQEGLHAAELVRSKENLHDWRKRVKDLWYQLRLLEPLWSKKLERIASQLEKLSEKLGEDHDLVMLEEAAQSAHLNEAELKLLSGAIAIRRKHLQEAAFRLGRKLYAEKPGVLARRIKHSWEQWHR